MTEPKYAFDPSEEEINNLTKSMNQFGLTEQESKRFIDVMEKKSMRKRIVYSLNDKLDKLKKQRRSTPPIGILYAWIELSIIWNTIKILFLDPSNSLTTDYKLEQLNKKQEL